MAEQISKMIIVIGGKEYEFDGGGGVEPGVPLPADVVDTDAIIDGAVEMQDLNDDVKKKIQKTYVQEDETLHMDFDEKESTEDAGYQEDNFEDD